MSVLRRFCRDSDRDEIVGVAEVEGLREWAVETSGKTYSVGTFSPNVRASFAMRLLRISASDGLRGMSGMTGESRVDVLEAVVGERGILVSEGDAGIVLTRSRGDCGGSTGLRGREENDFGVGRVSAPG